jgi:hypothetical protein
VPALVWVSRSLISFLSIGIISKNKRVLFHPNTIK